MKNFSKSFFRPLVDYQDTEKRFEDISRLSKERVSDLLVRSKAFSRNIRPQSLSKLWRDRTPLHVNIDCSTWIVDDERNLYLLNQNLFVMGLILSMLCLSNFLLKENLIQVIFEHTPH